MNEEQREPEAETMLPVSIVILHGFRASVFLDSETAEKFADANRGSVADVLDGSLVDGDPRARTAGYIEECMDRINSKLDLIQAAMEYPREELLRKVRLLEQERHNLMAELERMRAAI